MKQRQRFRHLFNLLGCIATMACTACAANSATIEGTRERVVASPMISAVGIETSKRALKNQYRLTINRGFTPPLVKFIVRINGGLVKLPGPGTASDLSKTLRAGTNSVTVSWKAVSQTDNDEDLVIQEYLPDGRNNVLIGVHVATGLWGRSKRRGAKSFTIHVE